MEWIRDIEVCKKALDEGRTLYVKDSENDRVPIKYVITDGVLEFIISNVHEESLYNDNWDLFIEQYYSHKIVYNKPIEPLIYDFIEEEFEEEKEEEEYEEYEEEEEYEETQSLNLREGNLLSVTLEGIPVGYYKLVSSVNNMDTLVLVLTKEEEWDDE